MTTPIDPSQSSVPPIQPQQPEQQPPTLPTSYVDPTGAWAKFLSTPGHAASADDVKMFMQGLLKFFSVIIQQQQDAYKRSMEQLKKVEEGDE